LPEGKKDLEFKKKPTLAWELIDKSLKRGYRPGIVLIDSSYGNNTSFLLELAMVRTKLSSNSSIVVKV
jgi:SRSO17 transposase